MLSEKEQKRWLDEAKVEVKEDVRQARMRIKQNRSRKKGPTKSKWRDEVQVLPLEKAGIEVAEQTEKKQLIPEILPEDFYNENDAELGETPEIKISTQERL